MDRYGLGQAKLLLSILLLLSLSGCSSPKSKDVTYYETHPLERDTTLDACMPEPRRKGGECRAAKIAADRTYAAIGSSADAR